MKTINLHHVMPHVFAQVPHLESEVWNEDLTFEKVIQNIAFQFLYSDTLP